MTDTQEAMREEFEKQFHTAEKIHWDADQESYRPNNPFDSGHVYAAAYQNMKLEGYKAATAQSAEKIARLEEDIAQMTRAYTESADEYEQQLSAAELSNRQLREALDAYVAKLTKWQPIETAPKDGTCILGWLDGGMTPIEFAYGNWRATYDFSVTKPIHWMPLPPAPKE